jgi:hypothetical protein
MVGRPKGLPRTGGRKRGTPNRKSVIRAQAIAESGLTGLGYLQSVYRDTKAPQVARIDCAKAAAPYESSRLATIEHVGKEGAPAIKIESLSDAQLERLVERLEQTG